MNEHRIAQDLMPQLQAIVRGGGFAFVTRLELMLGSRHGAVAELLEHRLEEMFAGTCFENAAIEVVVVEPMREAPAPGRSDTMTARIGQLVNWSACLLPVMAKTQDTAYSNCANTD